MITDIKKAQELKKILKIARKECRLQSIEEKKKELITKYGYSEKEALFNSNRIFSTSFVRSVIQTKWEAKIFLKKINKEHLLNGI